MRQHKSMFQYVEEILCNYDRKKGDKSKNKIAYDRYAHTERVYQWMIRITDELRNENLDLESLKIATIERWNSGLPFDGFEKGAAEVTFTVKNGKANGALVLGKVSNQGLTSVHLGDGEKIAPMIAFDGAFGSMLVEKDREVLIPTAYVYDVFDGQSMATMSIMAPNGEYLKKNVSTAECKFTASEYGIYYVSYDVRDLKGNRDTINYLIVVSDNIAPALTVNGTYQSEYKGEVTVLSATATDNVDGELPVTIWIEKADKTTREVQVGETVSLEKGTYKIVYYAMDENGNFAVQRFEIKVK